jgi:hypothetical protein
MTRVTEEVLCYLIDTEQFDLVCSVSKKIWQSGTHPDFVEDVLASSFFNKIEYPTLEEQINSPDFAYWKALVAFVSDQGFMSNVVLEEIQ